MEINIQICLYGKNGFQQSENKLFDTMYKHDHLYRFIVGFKPTKVMCTKRYNISFTGVDTIRI